MVNKRLMRVNEKSVLYMIFIILAILVIGSLFIIKPRFTGLAIIEGYDETECIEAGYIWEDLINETCTEIPDCEIGVTGCVDTCEECEDVITGQECSDLNYITQEDCETAGETWDDIIEQNCTEIPDCEIGVTGCVDTCEECEDVVIGGQCTGDVCDSSHLTLCDDTNCVDVGGGYWYDNECNAAACVPDSCGSLGYTCGSASDGCGGTLDCGTCNSGYSCVNKQCQEDATSSDDDTSSSSGSGTGATVKTIDDMKSSCVSNWSCDSWGACINGKQTRECTDINGCIDETSEPNVTQSCEGEVEVSETCSDGIKNQDENGIDCGGVCEQRCSFFTIMGNAVNVPINSSKQFIENNKVVSFTILGLIVLAVSWILIARFVLKKKDIFFFVKDINFDFLNFLKKEKKVNSNNPNT